LNATVTHQKRFTGREWAGILYFSVVVFCTYASVFAFRKPFTVATFSGTAYGGVPYQTWLIVSQVIGYMLSKFYGIRFIAELQRLGRWKTSAVLLLTAWLSWLLFALVPAPWGIPCLLVNGFVLGFMWGIVFSYVEGRRATDFIGVVLAVSFIFAGGFSRSVGKWLLLEWKVSEYWMPFATASLFAVPLLLFYYLMEQAPPPDRYDQEERTIRQPMDRAGRKQFLQRFAPGVLMFVFIYLLLTILRDLRDNYMANMWNELGYAANAGLFSQTETITSLVVLVVTGGLVFVRKNKTAFLLIHLLLVAGFVLAGTASFLFRKELIGGVAWMQLTGLGLYLSYVLFNSVFFERLLATFRVAGNVGFLIYIADAWGYLGSISIMFTKEFARLSISWVSFYAALSLVLTLAGAVTAVCSWFYFSRKMR